MVKKIFRYSILSLVIIIASVFCVGVCSNKINTVKADEIGQVVSLSYTTNSTGFDMGTVEGYGEYPVGSNVTLTAIPNEGCEFVKWQIWDDTSSSYIDLLDKNNEIVKSNPYTFMISKNTQIKAYFDFTDYKITDNFNCFTIKEISYEYDEERFSESNIANYPRAKVENNKIDGNFYYNDIVTLKYSLKNNLNFVKEFNSSSFVINKKIMLISVDDTGSILWTESGGTKDLDLLNESIDEYEFDLNTYDYVIVTNVKVGSNYVATNLELKTKITKDLNILATESNLSLITMTGLLEGEDGAKVSLDMAEIEDAVEFEYGYYGQITDSQLVADLGLESTNRYYLVESNANYKLSLSDNFNYVYMQTNASTERIIEGYFDASITGFTFLYKKRGYEITFTQMVKTDSGYESVDVNWANLTSISTIAGNKLKVEYEENDADNDTDNEFVVYINDVASYTIKPFDNVFGFEFYGFSNTASLDEKNTSIEYTVDKTNPTGTTLYIILTKIKYNFTFGVADINEDYSAYFTERVINLPEDTQHVRLDQISLSAIVPNGFIATKWIIIENGVKKDLNQTIFYYIPSSNNVEVKVLLVVEYKYFEFNFELEGFAERGNVADTELYIVEYFTMSEDKSTITINGLHFSHALNNDEMWEHTLTKNIENTTQLEYKSNIASVIVDPTYSYLTLNGVKYLHVNNQYRRYNEGARTTITCTTTDNPYALILSNVCVDDMIFATSTLKSNYNSTYQFLHFIKEGTHLTLPAKISGSSAYYISTYNVETTLIVKYSQKNQKISVAINNEKAFPIDALEIDCGVEGSVSYVSGDKWYIVEIDPGKTMSIKVEKSKIVAGYTFAGVDEKFFGEEATTYVWGKDFGSEDDVELYYVYEFIVSSNHENSIITVNFEEIVYTVNIDTTANVSVYDFENNDLMLDKSFKISRSILETSPELTVNSSQGFYVSSAYLTAEENKFNSLLGTMTEQTNKTHVFSEADFLLIVDLFNSSKEIKLCIGETRRVFDITIQYICEQNVSEQYFKDAEITCSYILEDEVQSSTKTAIATIGQSSTIYTLKFEKIKFETDVELLINDNMLEGLYFSNWIFGEVEKNELTQKFQLLDDMYIYVNFVAIDYTLTFKYLDENKQESTDIVSGGSFTIEDLSASYFNIGKVVDIKIVEKTGYRLTDIYYTTDNSGEVSLFEGLTSDETAFYYSITEFIPSVFLSSTRDQQIDSAHNRNLVINLVFEEKVYTISTIVVNNTRKNANSNVIVNTISSKELADWVDAEKLSVKYLLGDEYVVKEPNADGVVNYSTNSYIQIAFNSAVPGISLKNIYLGSNKYKVTEIGENDLAGQVAVLTMETIDGLDYYVLTFMLNSELLETVGTTSNFEISFVYEIKKYIITFTTNTINGKLLAKEYSLKLSYVPTNKQQFGEGVSTTGAALKNATTLSKSTLFYGAENTWTILYDTSTGKDFDKKYNFGYFYVVVDGNEIRFGQNASGNEFNFGLERTYKDQNGKEFVLWDIIASNTRPTIYAYYEPKISYGENFKYVDGKYVKTVTYNGEVQALTTSFDESVTKPDIIYAPEFGKAIISYSTANGTSSEPKDANTYKVSISIVGIVSSDEVYLIINKKYLTINSDHVVNITKQYDGTDTLTDTNIYDLQGQITLDGLAGLDVGFLDLSMISGYYADFNVGKKIDITVNQIRLSPALTTNYYIVEGIDQVVSLTLKEKGEITRKELTINANTFTFYNIVYKANQDCVLKYTQNAELIFNEELAGSDECFIDSGKLQFTVSDYSIGYDKTVTVNLSACLDGADNSNYYINNIFYKIDIYPYEIVYEIDGLGRFTITDYDEGCFIPIETRTDGLKVDIINNGHEDYPELYNLIEPHITGNEKFKNFYRYNITTIYGNTVNVNSFVGAYVTFTDVKNMTAIYDVDNGVKDLDINKTNKTVKIKIGENTGNTFAIMVTKSYFAVWKILLIVGLCLLFLIIIIIAVIIYKKIRAKKTDSKHKI